MVSNYARRDLVVTFGAVAAAGGLAALPSSAQVRVPPGAARLPDNQIVANLKARIARAVAEDRFSGAVLLTKGERLLFEGAYGRAAKGHDARNHLDTKFVIASMGKMFTGLAILQLVQEKKLSLDAKLIDVLPGYPNNEVAREITIAQLLTHTSGLGDFFTPDFFNSSMSRYDTLEAYLPLFVDAPLMFRPGSRWSYSNAGYIVLGLVVQEVSGQSYYDYVQRRIFDRAGMENSGFWGADQDVRNRALGYLTAKPQAGPPRTNVFSLPRGSSAGGACSTARDLGRFSSALRSHKLLDANSTNEFLSGRIATVRQSRSGYGTEEFLRNGIRVVGHGGNAPGIDARFFIYPELGYTVVVLSNYDNGARVIYNSLEWDLTGQRIPEPLQLPSHALNSFAGSYVVEPPEGAPPGLSNLPPWTVNVVEGKLRLDTGRSVGEFVPTSSTTFVDPLIPDARLTFPQTAGGPAPSLTMEGVAPFFMTLKASRRSAR